MALAFGAAGSAETLTFEGAVTNATVANIEVGVDRVIVSGPDTHWSAFDIDVNKYFLDERGSNFTVLGAAGVAADLLAPGLVGPGQDMTVLFKAMQDSFVFSEDEMDLSPTNTNNNKFGSSDTDVLEKFQKEIEVSKNAKVLKGYGQMYKKAMTKAKSDAPAVYQHTKTMYEDKLKELNGKESNV